MNITSAKITGTPDTSGLTLAHDNFPDDPSLANVRGRLMVLVSASFTEARDILDTIIKGYYDNKASSPFHALKESIESSFKEGSEIAGASLVGSSVSVVAAGGAQVALLRSGMLAKLLISSPKDSISASGVSQEGDTLVLATSHIFKAVPEGVLKANLQASNVDVVVEALAPVLESKNSSRAGIVVIKFASDKVFNPFDRKLPVGTDPTKIGVRRQVAGFLDRILEALPERGIFVKHGAREFEAQDKKNVAALVGVILLLLLLVSIGFGIRQRGINLSRAKYESRLEEAEHQFQESEALAEIDSTRARELILSAKETAEALKNEGVKDPQLDTLYEDIKEAVGKIAGIYETASEHFLDLSLLSSGLRGDDLSFSDGRVLVLDKAGEKLVEVRVSTKKSKVLAGPEVLTNPVSAAAYSERSFILDSEGVKEVDEKASLVIDKDWADEAFFSAYFGNIYVLDRENSKVLRYAGDQGEFGSKQNWFGPGVNPDLSGARAWTIDGSVWVLTESGKILRFTRGSPQAFSLKGLGGDLSGAKAIFSDEQSDFLYILDTSGGRVVVVKKDGGEFKAEYLDDKIRESVDFIVSETDKKIILLNGEKLYSIEIKHID